MIRNNEGLTKTYNRFHDPDETAPDILELRRLHAAMDRAVLDAYGWSDIPTDCIFRLDYEEPEDEDAEETGKKRRKKKPWRLRWPETVHDEVLARLLALNQQRAEEERKLAAPKKEKPKAPRAAPAAKPRRAVARPSVCSAKTKSRDGWDDPQHPPHPRREPPRRAGRGRPPHDPAPRPTATPPRC
jgi:hypothetical protein